LWDGAYIALGSEQAVITASARRTVQQLVPNGQERAVKQGDLIGRATGELSLKRTTAKDCRIHGACARAYALSPRVEPPAHPLMKRWQP